MTVSLPQFASQMFPWRSERVAWGKEIPPWVKPLLGDRGLPCESNSETVLLAGTGQDGAAKPKFPTQTLPRGSRVIPNPAPLRPPPV